MLNNVLLENNEYGIYVKGGVIIPIKLHNGAQSILRTIYMPIRLDVYLDKDASFAEGQLYMDDGETFRYKNNNEKLLIQYTYTDGSLYSQSMLDATFNYEPAFNLKITEVNVYGIRNNPKKVTQPTIINSILDFDYSSKRQSIQIRGLNFPLETDSRRQRKIIDIDFSE